MTRTVSNVASDAGAGRGASVTASPYWDVWVRLFHWSLVLGVGFQLLSGLTGFEFIELHGTVGEVVLALVVFRLLWGVVGSPNARLSALFAGPSAVLRHLRELRHRRVPPENGHSAAGGWAVLAMLLIVGVQAVTGLFIADEDELLEGALYGDVASGTSDLLWQIHEINANLLEAIVILHVAMIAIYGLWARRDLLTPMIRGRARAESKGEPGGDPSPGRAVARAEPRGGILWKGVLCAFVALLGVGWVSDWF